MLGPAFRRLSTCRRRHPSVCREPRLFSVVGGYMSIRYLPALPWRLLLPALTLAFTPVLRAGELAVTPDRFDLAGMQDGRQLLVTARGEGGREQDRTRAARYTVA